MTTPSSHETRQKAAAMRAAHALASFEEILEVVARKLPEISGGGGMSALATFQAAYARFPATSTRPPPRH